MSSGGVLSFPDLNYKYSPVQGDLVVFPSKPLEFVHEVEEINEERYTIPVWLTEYEFFKI
jgi:Rps23 Pro-64 3,4-dihydroxylase Tpa1-like proline 4-hydroxylase